MANASEGPWVLREFRKAVKMPNMSYCRFANTKADLGDCLDAIRQNKRLSGFEVNAGKRMFREFLTFCRDYDIIGSFNGEMIDETFNELAENESGE